MVFSGNPALTMQLYFLAFSLAQVEVIPVVAVSRKGSADDLKLFPVAYQPFDS
jgi:hypothetical protein